MMPTLALPPFATLALRLKQQEPLWAAVILIIALLSTLASPWLPKSAAPSPSSPYVLKAKDYRLWLAE